MEWKFKLASRMESLRIYGRQLVRELGVLEHKSRPLGISLEQCHILVEIEVNEGLIASDLVRILHIEKTLISKLLAQLANQGLITSIVDKSDKRKKTLRLTVKGKTKVKSIHQSANSRISDALSHLKKSEQQKILNGLKLYVDALVKVRS